MNKFSHEEGLTLIELLITLAVIAIVFAIAVPVFSNVLAGAQTSADSAQAAALSSFHDEYASTTLAFANGKTTATLNGVVIASIKGDATSGSTGGGNTTPVVAGYVFDTTGATVPGDAAMNGESATWSASTPVLMVKTGDYMSGNPSATFYSFGSVSRAQSIVGGHGTVTVNSDKSVSVAQGSMGTYVLRNLTAAPTAGSGATIVTL